MDKTKIPLPRCGAGVGAGAEKKPPIKSTLGILRRRSKSTSDLRKITAKPIITQAKVPLKPIKQNVPYVPKFPIKRPAEKKPEEVPKAKVLKPSKPAPYDYKARFGLLQEKHNNLIETTKTLKQQHADMVDCNTKYENLQQDYAKVMEENIRLKSENETIYTKNKQLTELVEELKPRCETLKRENVEVIDENHRFKTALTETKKQLEDALCREEMLNKKLKNLQEDIQDHENLRRNLHNQIQDLKGHIRVFCRIRPHLPSEQNKMLSSISCTDDKSLEIRKSKESINSISGRSNDIKQEFMFDKVFPPESTQSEVFEDLAQLVQSALDGYNVCVFAYGQTGSGKTYTMQGYNGSVHLGMIPRTVDLIFETIQKLENYGWLYSVEASFLEIYNENVRDLADPFTKKTHDIRYNDGKGTIVTNLKIEIVKSARHLHNLMAQANTNRAVAATDFNEHSSRSHAVTRIILHGTNPISGANYLGSLNLVDLAGSESAKTSSSERINETKNINKSLSTLGSVMLALHNNDSHIPYRNSKLTYLLQSSLGGNSKTLMIVNVAPLEDCYNETINSLRFAAKVKEVKISSKRNRAMT